MNADYFRTLYRYHYDTLQQIWDSAFSLTDAQFTQECDYSIGSVRNHLVHVTGAEQRWLNRMTGAASSERLVYEDYPTAASIYPVWQQLRAAMLTFVDGLQDDDLARVVEYDIPHRGGIHRDPLWLILTQVSNHGTDHRAQVLRLLYDLGAPTFE